MKNIESIMNEMEKLIGNILNIQGKEKKKKKKRSR